MEIKIEQVMLDPATFSEDPNGKPYTRKTIANNIIIYAGHYTDEETTQSEEENE